MRQESGGMRQQMWDRRRETGHGDRRPETWEGRRETGDFRLIPYVRREAGDMRPEK